MRTLRRGGVAAALALGVFLGSAEPAWAYTSITRYDAGFCTTQYTVNGAKAFPIADLHTTLTWSGTSLVRTNSEGVDLDYGNAGFVCGTNNTARTYKIRVTSWFVLDAHVGCSGGYGITVPGVLTIGKARSSCGHVEASYDATCTPPSGATSIHECDSPIGALSFGTSGTFNSFGRVLRVTLWKSKNSTNPYTFSTLECSVTPSTTMEQCV